MKTLTFGQASDGLPVNLDLDDPTPGPILVIGDSDAGNTAFLKAVALGAVKVPLCSAYVITNHLDEWQGQSDLGYLRSFVKCTKLLTVLAGRLSVDKNPPTVLLIDGMDKFLAAQRQNFLQLVDSGPRYCIWPVITLSSKMATPSVIRWIGKTKLTIILGQIADPNLISQLNVKPTDVQSLGKNWFWNRDIEAFKI